MATGAAGRRRWIYPALCFVITFLGGTLYSYSIVGYEIQRLWGVSAAEAGIPYLAALGVYGYLMVLGGVLERRFGSEKVPLYLGALMFGLGFTSSSFVDRNVALFTASYLIAGLGLALMDSMTLPIATSWVPDRPGLAVGVARTGFGIAPLVVAPLLEHLFKAYGFNAGLRIVGVAYLVVALAVASLAKVNPNSREKLVHGDVGRELLAVLSAKCFWLVWLLYSAGLFTSLAYVGYAKQIGVELASVDAELMSYLIAAFSIFNGASRVISGRITDAKGFLFAATLNYALTSCALTALWLYPTPAVFAVSSIIIYANLGGWLVIAPAEVRSLMSPEKYALTWPLLMTGYASAAFAGTAVAGILRDVHGSFEALLPVALSVTLTLGLLPLHSVYRRTCKSHRSRY